MKTTKDTSGRRSEQHRCQVSETVARQDALTTRLQRIEAGLGIVMQDQNHAAETAREYQAKSDQCSAQIERVSGRIRTQECTMTSLRARK